jgi:hypothetical protein
VDNLHTPTNKLWRNLDNHDKSAYNSVETM